jgi:hypothetical protein
MRRRLTSILAAASAASVLYSTYLVAGITGTSSSPCIPPSLAVDFYAIGVIPGLFGLNDTALFRDDACEEACKTWRGTCRGIVDDAKSCSNSALSKTANVFLEGCASYLDSDLRKQCKDDIKGELDFLKNETKFDAKFAETCCNDFYQPCIDACLSGNESLIPECAIEEDPNEPA